LPKDFEKAYKSVVKKRDQDFDFYHWGELISYVKFSLLKIIWSKAIFHYNFHAIINTFFQFN
jgi:hypothetical protein